jgi:hypothetical protein
MEFLDKMLCKVDEFKPRALAAAFTERNPRDASI